MATSTRSSTRFKYYQPEGRVHHSTVRVGDYLYLFPGEQCGPPRTHDKSDSLGVDKFDLTTGKWEHIPVTGNVPLGISGYCSVAIDNDIYFFGGDCGHDNCRHNSLHSLNVMEAPPLNWSQRTPTTTDSNGYPSLKSFCGMVAVCINGDYYLVVFGGVGPISPNTPRTPGAQYDEKGDLDLLQNNELHLFHTLSGQWITPVVSGDIPPPCDSFTLTSITNNCAVMFGGFTPNGSSDVVYFMTVNTSTSVTWNKMEKPIGRIKWPRARYYHCSALINTSSGPHLLVVGGVPTADCLILNINERTWKEIVIPDTFCNRYQHSLSILDIAPNVVWIIVIGGSKIGHETILSDTAVLELKYSPSKCRWYQLIVSFMMYQETLVKRREELGVDPSSSSIFPSSNGAKPVVI